MISNLIEEEMRNIDIPYKFKIFYNELLYDFIIIKFGKYINFFFNFFLEI